MALVWDGAVSEEMSLRVVSYGSMSPARVLVRAWQVCFSSLSLLYFCSSTRIFDLIVPSPQLWLLCLKTCVPLPWSQWGSVSAGRENAVFWITQITQDSRTRRNTAPEQPSCELAQLEGSQAAGRAVLSQAEGSPRLHPVSDQPVASAQQKSTGAGQVRRYFLHFILSASGSLEFRDFLIQCCIFISEV